MHKYFISYKLNIFGIYSKKSQDSKSDHLPILYGLIAVHCISLVVIALLIYNLFISVTEQLLITHSVGKKKKQSPPPPKKKLLLKILHFFFDMIQIIQSIQKSSFQLNCYDCTRIMRRGACKRREEWNAGSPAKFFLTISFPVLIWRRMHVTQVT